MSKRITIITLCIAVFGTLCGCGESSSVTLRDDVPTIDISAAIDSAITSDGLITVDESYILGRMKIDTSKCSDYIVRITSIGTAIDEYGIFRTADEAAAAEIASQAETYLERYLASWMEEYRPEEKPKLLAAKVHTVGVYVFYSVMSETDSDAALSALNDLIN